MRSNALRFIEKTLSVIVMLAIMVSITPINTFALDKGTYTADIATSYKNPSTGQIEDSGGEKSYALGQSMTESVTYKKALLEIDSSSNMFLTLRIQLMDNIQSVNFETSSGGSGFSKASATVMQQNTAKHTADYRFRIDSENAVIRCRLYVTPMKREVVYFIKIKGLEQGSSDFITSIKSETPKNNSESTANASSNNQNSQNDAQKNDAENKEAADKEKSEKQEEKAKEAEKEKQDQEQKKKEAEEKKKEQEEKAKEEAKNKALKKKQDAVKKQEVLAAQKKESNNKKIIIAAVIIVLAGAIRIYQIIRKKRGSKNEI